jgi:hypothetical protein
MMSTLSLRLPDSLHAKLAELAEADGISLNQLLCTAASEKLAALMTESYLHERARRGSAEKLRAVLAKIPAVPPVRGDEIPEDIRRDVLEAVHSKRRSPSKVAAKRRRRSTPR